MMDERDLTARKPQTFEELWRLHQAAVARITRLEEQLSDLNQRHTDHTHIRHGVGEGNCYDQPRGAARRNSERHERHPR